MSDNTIDFLSKLLPFKKEDEQEITIEEYIKRLEKWPELKANLIGDIFHAKGLEYFCLEDTGILIKELKKLDQKRKIKIRGHKTEEGILVIAIGERESLSCSSWDDMASLGPNWNILFSKEGNK